MPQPIAVFDLDGTLVDTAPDLANALNACLVGAGLTPSALDDIRPHAGHGARVMLQHAFGRAGHPLPDTEMERQLAIFLAHYEAHIADLSRPLPGVVDAMDRLAAAGYVLAICTNKTERLSVKLLETLRLADRFAAICGADTFAGRKPDPRHLLGTINRAGGGAAFLVGDTATDTDAAIAAAVPCVLVDFGYAPEPRARADATLVISNYELLDAALADRLIDRRG